MIRRQIYIDALLQYKDTPVVKILAGIRRCGKSTILEMYREELIDGGISPDHVISKSYTSDLASINFTADDMFNEIEALMHGQNRYYLLLDEVQEVDGWEKAINKLLETTNCDIYVTGSNSKLMASEISTYLSGRYVSIPVYTLSFREYADFKGSDEDSIDTLLDDYIRTGGFPIVALGDFNETAKMQIVEGIYNSVVSYDITQRHNVANIDLFNRVVKYIIENVGKTFSANSIVKFLKSEKRTLSAETVYNYIDWLERAFIIYRCNRYDLQGKSVLKTQEKFYLADQSLKYALISYNPTLVASMLENIVYFELRRRGYHVYIGKIGSKEIDFVAERSGKRVYFQVCMSLPEDSNRETENLKQINDNYKKYVLVLNRYDVGNIDGIEVVYLTDFLLNSEMYC